MSFPNNNNFIIKEKFLRVEHFLFIKTLKKKVKFLKYLIFKLKIFYGFFGFSTIFKCWNIFKKILKMMSLKKCLGLKLSLDQL